MKLSIFRQIDEDANKSCGFWHKPDERSTIDINTNKLYQGYLLITNGKEPLQKNLYILTATSLYKYKENNKEIESVSNIRWKILEPFIEVNPLAKRQGFKLRQTENSQDFYTENTEDLDIWISMLSKVSILTDVEDDYAIIKTLGKGSYATVYLVDDLDTYDNYALKSIDKSNIENQRAISTIANEIEILRIIDHPNVTKLYKVYESDTHIHLIMDYVPGINMLQKIMKIEKFSEKKAAVFLYDMLDILCYLHSKNIVHRDIKLENIIIYSENPLKFKLLDFGLSGISSSNDQTLRCGSPGYIAPEILKKQRYGVKVDLFGLGVCLFMILSGRSPFPGKDLKEILKSNKRGIIYFSPIHWKLISKDAVDLILKLCQPIPDLRLSANEALNHIWLKKVNKDPIGRLPFLKNYEENHQNNHIFPVLSNEDINNISEIIHPDGAVYKLIRRSSVGGDAVVAHRKVIR